MWEKLDKLTGFILAFAFLTVIGTAVIREKAPARIVTEKAQKPMPITVEVTGEVTKPGRYVLDKGSRVCDLLYAAGGVTANADTEHMSLGARLMADTTIDVPSVDDKPRVVPVININTADKAELMLIPGIGDYLADNIIAYRKSIGKFSQISDINEVKGIGDKTYSEIEPYITVDDNK